MFADCEAETAGADSEFTGEEELVALVDGCAAEVPLAADSGCEPFVAGDVEVTGADELIAAAAFTELPLARCCCRYQAPPRHYQD